MHMLQLLYQLNSIFIVVRNSQFPRVRNVTSIYCRYLGDITIKDGHPLQFSTVATNRFKSQTKVDFQTHARTENLISMREIGLVFGIAVQSGVRRRLVLCARQIRHSRKVGTVRTDGR